MASQATPGIEAFVNTDMSFGQYSPFVTALADGGWVVTWGSSKENSGDIYQQRYNANGHAVGSETLVNTYILGYQTNPSVAALSDGGWVVTWESYSQDGSGYGVYQQRYNADGNATDSENLVNTYTADHQSGSSVTGLADGGWVVTWHSVEHQGASYTDIYQQRYDVDGNAVGSETLVNTDTYGGQLTPFVTALADGGWIVTWESYGINQQRYNSDGDAVGSEIHVNTSYASGGMTVPSVTGLADGGWLVTWQSADGDSEGTNYNYGIYQQRYDADGDAAGSENRVNTYTADGQTAPSVAALADGGWVVTWESDGQDGSGGGIYQQRYDSDGDTVGSETRVNAFAVNSQDAPSVTALADGGWVVTWQSYDPDTGYDIRQRHFAADVRGTAHADTLTGTNWDEYLVGYAGNDTLDGRGGKDIMVGGAGNDTYVVNSSGDQVQELPTQGTDTVRSSVTYSLAKFGAVENLTLTGTAGINATGNGLANTITGNAGANKLSGGGGSDKLYGGFGNDLLIGGTGKDTFIFNTKFSSTNIDTIDDFSVKDDTIFLDDDIFTKAGNVGDLLSSAFYVGTKAHDSSDRIIYDNRSGKLWYDADGTGAAKAVQFALLDTGLKMTASDFDILA